LINRINIRILALFAGALLAASLPLIVRAQSALTDSPAAATPAAGTLTPTLDASLAAANGTASSSVPSLPSARPLGSPFKAIPPETIKKLPGSREIFAVKDIPQSINLTYDIGEVAVGNPAIVSIVADRARKRIVLSPLEVGETAVLIFDTNGKQRDNIQITVTSTDLDQFVKDLKFLFRDIEGLQFRRVGRKVVIEGEVYLQSDLDRIKEVLRGNEFVVNLVTLSQDTQRILARRIKDEIGIAGVDVQPVKDRIVLRGEVGTKEESDRAEKYAEIYVNKENLVNVIAVNSKKSAARSAKLIQVTAYFVQLDKSFLRNFNFSWTPIANTQIAYDSSAGKINFFAVVTEFLPKLSTAKALGVARVFENPTVSVKSGEDASIDSGGDVYLPVPTFVQSNGAVAQNPNPTRVGVTLNVTPTADDRDFVDMKVSVRVAKLGAAPKEGLVLINESSVNTSQYVRSGETVAIGGVLRSAFGDVKDAPPDQPFSFQPLGSAGQVNLTSSFGNIFQIFKSRSINSDRSMFIVFVTPEILVSAREASRSLRENVNLNGVDPKAPVGPEELE